MNHSAHAPDTTCASLGFTWEAVSSHELPGGTLFWLRISPTSEGLAGPAAARELAVAETGVVARLQVHNPGPIDVLLASDVILDGGKQTRVVVRSVIVPSGGKIDLPVRCVEEGRWGARDAATANRFEVTEMAGIDTREHVARLKQRTLHRSRAYDLDQREMWTHVTSTLSRESLRSDTSSYSAVMAKRARRRTKDPRALDVRPPEGANAVAVMRAGADVWVEAWPSHAHAAAAVPSFVVDLLDPGPAARDLAIGPERALEALWAASALAVPAVDGSAGHLFAVDADGVAGSMLMHGDELAHLAVTVRGQQ